MQDFQKLEVWQRSHQVGLTVYRLTAQFPAEERFGLTSQIRRCAVSIASNIAEGCGRQSDADFRRLLSFAMGSACELEYQLMLSRDLGYVGEDETAELLIEVVRIKKMLTSLMAKLNGDIDRNRQPTTANR